MKKIEAYIRPEKLEDVKECLKSTEVNGMSIIQVMGFGNQKGWKEIIRGSKVDYYFHQKIKIEIFVSDSKVNGIVDCLLEYARTGEVGDGKIFISGVETAIRIRTNERDDEALK